MKTEIQLLKSIHKKLPELLKLTFEERTYLREMISKRFIELKGGI